MNGSSMEDFTIFPVNIDEFHFCYLEPREHRIMKLDRLRLRGLTGATDEFTLAATVQNLRRMAKLLPHGPPITG